MRRLVSLYVPFILALAGSGLGGATLAQNMPVGDIQAGRVAAELCSTCHGVNGISTVPGVPHLAGQHADYIVRMIKAYQADLRHEEKMHTVTMALGDEDIANLAAYFSSRLPFRSMVDLPLDGIGSSLPDDTDPFEGIRGTIEQCAGCHGDDGNTEMDGMPGLAGQHELYLGRALKAYRDGSRGDGIMTTLAKQLSDTEIEDIAYFYAVAVPEQAPITSAGDPYAGLAASVPCAGCHGNDGNSMDPGTPRLAGLDGNYLAVAIDAYRDGPRTHVAMQDAVAEIRQAEIVDIAAFYASKTPKAAPIRKPLTTAEWVENCNRCHGPEGNSADPRYPVLAGQSESYLVKALKLYHVGERENSMMYAMSFQMSEADILRLAAYYSSRTAE